MKLGDLLPPLDGASAWLNGKPDISRIAGHPTLVHFWSRGCPLCHDGIPELEKLRGRFSPLGLVTLAVFQLRPHEMFDAAAAERDARELMNLDYPCALDASGVLARRFESAYAPGYFLFDREHRLRHRQMGNALLERVEGLVERMLVKASYPNEAY
jgi:thiol-disulfide isomerase/thioredoxin